MPSAYLKSKMKSYMQDTVIVEQLQAMLDDIAYTTQPGYSIDAVTYPDHSVPFVQHHMNYLKKHPHVDPQNYLSNLRLMLKTR